LTPEQSQETHQGSSRGPASVQVRKVFQGFRKPVKLEEAPARPRQRGVKTVSSRNKVTPEISFQFYLPIYFLKNLSGSRIFMKKKSFFRILANIENKCCGLSRLLDFSINSWWTSTDARILKIFSPKIYVFAQTTVSFCKNLILTWVFEKKIFRLFF
jgi:hypothetical protein